MYDLVIAEKPSVAQAIAKVLGCTGRKDGYLFGGSYLVSWCVGHLVGLAQPQEYDEKYEKWRREDLPIIPEQFQYRAASATKKQFQVLKSLLQSKDVKSVINACDAGREGELIFRLVYEQAGCKKPMKRLWISSMEDEAILNGFRNLKSGAEYDRLYEAALCRERADWIVGINATRFFSTVYGATLNVGRVMTPTLALCVQRQAQIRAFRSEPFYQVQLMALDGKLTFTGERIMDKSEAYKMADACKAEGVMSVTKNERKEKTENAPALYDLTSLQRDANKKLGYTAQQTLDYAQSLYEKKLLTYPRTDSRFLTDDMGGTVESLLSILQEKDIECTPNYKIARVLNSKKVTDHHAIIPTAQIEKADLNALPEGERQILLLVSVRLAESVSEPAKYNITEGEVMCLGKTYTYKCKHFAQVGWRNVDGIFESDADVDEGQDWFSLDVGEEYSITDTSVKEGKTTAPKSFTEDTLLLAMEKAGKEETPDEAERKGLGTPATRAGIIEKLVRVGFLKRQGEKKTKYLVPTQIGEKLITVVPEAIQSPLMTAEWEQRLLEIEKGMYGSEKFMKEISDLIKDLVRTYQQYPVTFEKERKPGFGKKKKTQKKQTRGER